MTIRIYDPSILTAQGALVDFLALQRRNAVLARFNDRKHRSLFLRWQTSPGVGLPTEPFKVWRRPALPLGEETPIHFDESQLVDFFAQTSVTVLQFDQPMASVTITVRSAAGGTIMIGALFGPPIIEAIVGLQTRVLAAGGSDTMRIQAPIISGLVLFNVDSFDPPTGLTTAQLEKTQDWVLVETVGLPVDEGDWAALGQNHGVKQGLVGAEVPARAAAVERFGRGVNPLGWGPVLPSGVPAPAWDLPDPALLVDEAAIELLPMLRQVAAVEPQAQAGKLFSFTIAPPQNPVGDVMPAVNPGKADLSPIGLLAMSIASDPMLAVTLGYGTGYADEDIPPLVFGDVAFFSDPSRSDWDWLITGMWERGLDGQSDPVEYAALVPRPGLALPAPTPADAKATFQAHLRPADADQPWLASVRVSWERFPINQFSNVASFAAARHQLGLGAAAEALLERRALTKGRRPIGNARNDRDPEPTRQSATDGALAIPNNPGSIAMGYAAATQTIFGIWSPWVEAPITIGQPEPAPVQILSSALKPVDPGSGSACPATLEFEFSVDWRVRRIDRIELRGLLFAAATRSTVPPAGPPTGMQRQLGVPGLPVVIDFAGDVPSLVGGTVKTLNPGGDAEVAAGPAQTSSRRYRVSLPGFTLDYAATPHIGLVLEARLTEHLLPHRVGPWSPSPSVSYASDPRARATVVIDLVRLASLPDSAGECHAHLDWNPMPGAIGYAVYESTETRILASHPGLPDPTPDRTLSQRLTTLKGAFNAKPLRRDFIRRNPDLIAATSVDVTLPRGSRDIHLFTIIPVSAGGIEGPWPSGANPAATLIPIAAPRIAEPAPPTIEVQGISDKPPAAPDYRARLRIGTRGDAGARPRRIDIYRVRVDDAARRLDSMGPPIASLMASDATWTVAAPAGGGLWIDTVRGDDRPAGSWRNVWYRAVAWSEDDPLRGVLKGRSQPSPAVSVLVPPAGPPPLSALTLSWPGGDPAAVLVSFDSAAPIDATPVGPHLISVEALLPGGVPLVQARTTLAAVATAQPVTGSGLWRQAGTPTPYRLLLRRAAIADVVSVIVRIIDPLGRTSESVITVPAGSVVPLPDLSPIDAFTISGRGQVYSFGTNAPDSDGMGGAYRIRVELVPLAAGPVPPFPRPRPLPFPRPAPSSFRLINGVYVHESPLADVPTLHGIGGIGPLPLALALALGRQPAPAEGQFSIASGIKLRSVSVRITTPDGRTVEQQRRG